MTRKIVPNQTETAAYCPKLHITTVLFIMGQIFVFLVVCVMIPSVCLIQ